jgi:hypothetical protein
MQRQPCDSPPLYFVTPGSHTRSCQAPRWGNGVGKTVMRLLSGLLSETSPTGTIVENGGFGGRQTLCVERRQRFGGVFCRGEWIDENRIHR